MNSNQSHCAMIAEWCRATRLCMSACSTRNNLKHLNLSEYRLPLLLHPLQFFFHYRFSSFHQQFPLQCISKLHPNSSSLNPQGSQPLLNHESGRESHAMPSYLQLRSKQFIHQTYLHPSPQLPPVSIVIGIGRERSWPPESDARARK